MPVELPVGTEKQEAAWAALFEIHTRLPDGWTLVGGQAVYLHSIEREAATVRPTMDADTVLDVRDRPDMLKTFTGVLAGMGFESIGFSMEGHEHRWVRGQAQIDVLIPRFTGERTEKRGGINGGTTVATPGGQAAINRSETVEVICGLASGSVNRPTLLGSLIGKAAAITLHDDPNPRRHFHDFLTMASVLRARDLRGATLGPAERAHLQNMLGHLTAMPALFSAYPGSETGVERIRIALRT